MTRLIALLLALTFVASAVAPVAAAQRAQAGESCPMMAHRQVSIPCIGAACPCEHGSEGLSPLSARLAVPVPTTTLAAPVPDWDALVSSRAPSPSAPSCPIDHPPNLAI